MSLSASVRALVGLGDAESGTDHFFGQRVSAVVLLLLGLWFVVQLASLNGFAHENVVAFVAVPHNRMLLSLLCVMLAYHSNLGVQVVIEDYVHGAGLHRVSIIISRIAHLLVAVLSIYAAFAIGVGA